MRSNQSSGTQGQRADCDDYLESNIDVALFNAWLFECDPEIAERMQHGSHLEQDIAAFVEYANSQHAGLAQCCAAKVNSSNSN